MKATVRLEKPKKSEKKYDVFLNGKRLKTGRAYEFNNENELVFIEKNIMLSGWWFFIVLFEYALALFDGEFLFDEVGRTKREIIKMKAGAPTGDMVGIMLPSKDMTPSVEGLENASIISQEEIDLPKVKRRLKYRRVIFFGTIIAFLLIVAILIIVSQLKKAV